MRRRDLLAAGVTPLLHGSAGAMTPLTLLPPGGDARFERAYFGLHVHNEGAWNWPEIDIGSLRLWDADVSWAYLERADWVGRVVPAEALHSIGQAPHHGLAFAISMRGSDEPNCHGVRGTSLVAKPASGKADRLGCGQHGGSGTYEQLPFLMIDGAGFAPAAVRQTEAAVVDIAPTILAHLGLAADGVDGTALQRRQD